MSAASAKHVFISYVREDASLVDALARDLRDKGIEVWLDRDNIEPGQRWPEATRRAIETGAYFIACFSRAYNSRQRTYMNEELVVAIEQLRQYSSDRSWFIPVLLSDCSVPDRDIGGGATLRDLQYVDLYRDWAGGVAQISRAVGEFYTSHRPQQPFCSIDELVIFRSRVFVDKTMIHLGKVMLLVGDNMTGKTFIFRILNCLAPELRHNLGSLVKPDEELHYSLRLRNPEQHEIIVECSGGQITVSSDNVTVPFIPLTADIFFQEQRFQFQSLENFLKRKRSEFDGEYDRLDDLELLSEYWQMTPELVRKLVNEAGSFVVHAFDNARFVEERGLNRLLVNDKRWRPDAPIHKISGGMLEMLSLDVAIAHARLMSMHMPTMLLLHLAHLRFDSHHMGVYVDFLMSDKVRFQTLIETPDERHASANIPWAIVRFRRANGKTVLESGTPL